MQSVVDFSRQKFNYWLKVAGRFSGFLLIQGYANVMGIGPTGLRRASCNWGFVMSGLENNCRFAEGLKWACLRIGGPLLGRFFSSFFRDTHVDKHPNPRIHHKRPSMSCKHGSQRLAFARLRVEVGEGFLWLPFSSDRFLPLRVFSEQS